MITRLTRLKLPVLIAIAAAVLVGGYFAYGMFMGEEAAPSANVPVEPVVIGNDAFIVNLADTDTAAYLKLRVAISLAPMTQVQHDMWTGAGGGGHGGPSEAPGPIELAKYAKLQDVVNNVASTFTYKEMMSERGKARFKERLLERFAQVHDLDEQKYKALHPKGEVHNPVHPPYKIDGVYFTEFSLQST